jgi:hypothetical protein
MADETGVCLALALIDTGVALVANLSHVHQRCPVSDGVNLRCKKY